MNESLDVRRSDLAVGHHGGSVEAAKSRAAQEMQAQMIIAQQFPRDEIASERAIVQACKRQKLAQQAMYAYPRGGKTVTGPSIRLAEEIARHWKNLDYGLKEISRNPVASEIEAYCFDLEANVRATRSFWVPHVRHTKRGSTSLEDPRDIYEHIANQGMRRVRAVILQVIPGDIVDRAIEECEKTLAGNNDEPIKDRIKRAVELFAEIGVSKQQLEKRLGKNLDAVLLVELIQLQKIYSSLRDGMSSIDQWFGHNDEAREPKTLDELTQEIEDDQATVDTDTHLSPEEMMDGFVTKSIADETMREQQEGISARLVWNPSGNQRRGNYSNQVESLINRAMDEISPTIVTGVIVGMLDEIGADNIADVPTEAREEFLRKAEADLFGESQPSS